MIAVVVCGFVSTVILLGTLVGIGLAVCCAWPGIVAALACEPTRGRVTERSFRCAPSA